MSAVKDREVHFYPGYDHRGDPEKQQYGCHGMDVFFILRVGEDAISWKLGTGWLPNDHGTRPLLAIPSLSHLDPNAGPVVIHSASKRQDWWSDGGVCEYIEADKCYGDVGYLVGDSVLKALASGGHDAVWARLAEIHDEWTRAVHA